MQAERGILSRKNRSRLTLGAAMPALLTGVATPLYAQEGETSAQPQAGALGQSRIPTIVVTANKREQTLQETPVAVSVVGTEEIEKAEIQDLIDLQTLVPSLAVRQGQSSGATTFYIRGFGNGSTAIGLEPSVGVFIDGVYRSRAAASISDLPNLERVEVLRGPQSTLFGKNASAGVISVTTKKPQFELDGHVETSLGNYDLFRGEAYITGPISDTLAVAVSGNFNTRSGFVEDLGTGEDYNNRDRWAVRGDILWEPSDAVSFRLIGDFDRIDENCCVLTNIIEGPTGAVLRAVGGQFVSEDPFAYEVSYNREPTNEIENYGFSLQGDVDLGFGTLTSITAWRRSTNESDFDSDFTSLDIFSTNLEQSEIETFTQELRIQSTGADNLIDWTIGGFYFDESVDIANALFYGQDARPYISAVVGNPALLPGLENAIGLPVGTFFSPTQGLVDSGGQDNTAWSAFGTLDFHITDRLTATIGMSYTEDEKQVRFAATSTDTFSSLNINQLGYTATLANLLAQQGVVINNPASVGPFVQANPALYQQLQQQALFVAQGDANPLNTLRDLQILPPFLAIPNVVEDGITNDDSTDFTARLSYDLTDEINVYVSYATGFKASSWNVSRISRPTSSDFTPGSPIVDPVTGQVLVAMPSSAIADAGLALPNLGTGTRFAGPEDSEVYELGVKAQFDTVSFNLTVFDQTIDNFQTNVFLEDGFVLANAAQQSTFGVEFDFTWSPFVGLLLSGGATFLDPVYDSFPNFGDGIDISGQQPQGIAETQFSLAANYGFAIGEVDAFIRADWQHLGNSAFFDDPQQQAIIDATDFTREQNLVNASFGISTAFDLDVTIWARNLLKDEFLVFASPAIFQGGSFNGAANQPRTFGMTVRKSF